MLKDKYKDTKVMYTYKLSKTLAQLLHHESVFVFVTSYHIHLERFVHPNTQFWLNTDNATTAREN